MPVAAGIGSDAMSIVNNVDMKRRRVFRLWLAGAIVLGLSGIVSVRGQAPEFTWTRQVESSRDSSGRGIAQDREGNVYATGEFGGTAMFGTTNLTSRRNTDLFIAKYTPSGDVLWVRQAGGDGDFHAYAIALDAEGNVSIPGWFCCGTVGFGETNVTALLPTLGDTFLAKYDSSGNLLWVRNHSSMSINLNYLRVAADTQGNSYLTGAFSQGVSFGTNHLLSSGSWDMFVVKYDSGGNVLWARKAGGAGFDVGLGIAADENGSVFVTGSIEASADFGGTNLANTSGERLNFVAKYDSGGDLLWVLGGTGGGSVAADAVGAIYATGTDASGYHVSLDKYGDAGNLLWRRQGAGELDVAGQSLAIDSMGNLALFGRFRGTAVFGQTNLMSSDSSYLDLFIARYDSTGLMLGVGQVAMKNYLSYPSITTDALGHAYVTGSFNGRTCFGDTCLTGNVASIFIAQLALPPPIERPPGDDFDDAQRISTLPYTNTLDTTAATAAGDDPFDCAFPGQTVWYIFTPDSAGWFEANTFRSDYDTIVAAYVGDRNDLHFVACNDNSEGLQSQIRFQVAARQAYHFMVGAPAQIAGRLQFTLKALSPPANDDIANATPITVLPHTERLETTLATASADDPVNCNQPAATVWYSLNPTQDLFGEISTAESDYPVMVAVYTGSRGSLEEVACLGSPYGAFSALAGTNYFLLVESAYPGSLGGQLTLAVAGRPKLKLNVSVDSIGSVDPRTGAATVHGTVASSQPATINLTGLLQQKIGRFRIISGEFGLSPLSPETQPILVRCAGQSSWSVRIFSPDGSFGGGHAFASISADADFDGDSAQADVSGTILLTASARFRLTTDQAQFLSGEPSPDVTPSLTNIPEFNYTYNNGAIIIARYTGSGGAVTIPGVIDGLPVTSIGDHAFQRSCVTSVTIPNNVIDIGDSAFALCTNLATVTIGNSVNSIGSDAFFCCINLTTVTIPDSVTTIGAEAFYACIGLTSIKIPNSVTSIGDYAFSVCPSLASITIGNGVTRIGLGAFSVCENLASATIGSNVAFIDSYAFYDCCTLKGIYFKGNAPSLGDSVLSGDYCAIVCCLPATTGWNSTFGDRQTVLWNPQVQTSDANFGVRTNTFGFTITGSSNLVILVEACTNLASPIWFPVGTNTLTGGSSYFGDPQWADYPARFYRLRSP